MPRGFQVAHGFAVGQAIRRNVGGGVWELAQSDNLSVIRGLVDVVIDADTFNFEFEGRVRLPAHGLTVGSVYFISAIVAGGLVTPQPSTGQEDSLLFVPDADNVVVIPPPGGAITYRRAFTNADLAGNVLTVTHNLNKQHLHVTIYDNADVLVPLSTITSVTATNATSMAVDLNAVAPIAGTWNLIVTG